MRYNACVSERDPTHCMKNKEKTSNNDMGGEHLYHKPGLMPFGLMPFGLMDST